MIALLISLPGAILIASGWFAAERFARAIALIVPGLIAIAAPLVIVVGFLDLWLPAALTLFVAGIVAMTAAVTLRPRFVAVLTFITALTIAGFPIWFFANFVT